MELEKLFKEYYRPLCLYALRFTLDTDAAEDIVQECFTALLSHRLSMLPLEMIPKTYPGNVSGGIGLVSVRSALEIPIAKWVCNYDINNYDNPDAKLLPFQPGV